MSRKDHSPNARRFLARLHHDESGPNTVEWVLLIVVGLTILVSILTFAGWVQAEFDEKTNTLIDHAFLASEPLEPFGTVDSTEGGIDSQGDDAWNATEDYYPPVPGTSNLLEATTTKVFHDASTYGSWDGSTNSLPGIWFGSDGRMYMWQGSGWVDIGPYS